MTRNFGLQMSPYLKSANVNRRGLTLLLTASIVVAWALSIASAQVDEHDPEKIADLIDELGDEVFIKREMASKSLESLGRPALTYLQIAADSSDDPEIRYRCKRIIARIAAAGAQKELEGMWQAGDQALVIRGGHWWWGRLNQLKPEQFERNRIKILRVSESFVVADLEVEIGHLQGRTCKAILRLDGDTLYYCGSYKSRPTGFDNGSGYTLSWKRVK